MPGLRDQIRAFIRETNCQRYLEIGFGDGGHFRSVPVKYKAVISPKCHIPEPHRAYQGISDEVFISDTFKQEEPFDVIFVDGLHHYPQVIRDIDNSLNFLSENGVIICHDINPFQMRSDRIRRATTYPQPRPKPPAWLGDSWKTMFHIKFLRPDLDYANIKHFPGYMVLWRVPKNIKRVMDYGMYVEDNYNDEYPFLDKDIEFGLKHENEYEFVGIDEALEKYRSRFKDK